MATGRRLVWSGLSVAAVAAAALALVYSLATYGKGWDGAFGLACYRAAWLVPLVGAGLAVVGLFAPRGHRGGAALGLLLNASWLFFMARAFTPQ